MKGTVKSYVQNIEPFNDYYCSCYVNALLSIILKYEPSYRCAAYINDYFPHFAEYEKLYFPYCEVRKKFYDTLEDCFEIEEKRYSKMCNCLDELKNNISENQYVFALVDLFYWDRSRNFKGNAHIVHPTLIVGYQDGEKIYALEDNLFSGVKFTIQEYSEQELKQAIVNRTKDNVPDEGFDYKVCKIRNNIKIYKIKIEEIIANAKKIINILTDKRFFEFNVLDEKLSLCNLNFEYIRIHTRYSHRNIANKYLFRQLGKELYISKQNSEKLQAMSDEIIQAVDFSKLIILKAIYKKNTVNVKTISRIWRNIFELEYSVWEYFVLCIN